VKKNLAEQGDSLGIPIYIEELTKRDKRFHQYKTVTAMSDWQKENITCSPVLIEIEAEPAYDPLLAKVHVPAYLSLSSHRRVGREILPIWAGTAVCPNGVQSAGFRARKQGF
jgi:hypothetical protein